jgi:hypothetical protein
MTGRLIRLSLYFGLLLTPVLYLPAILEMTTRVTAGGLPPGHGVIAIKAAKDILLLTVFLFFCLDVLRGYPFVGDPFVWLLAGGIGISFLVSLSLAGPVLGLIGLRGISPFILIFVGYRYVDTKALRTIVRILGVLLAIETSAAIVRAFYGVPVDGRTFFGLVARPSGTFVSPTSWSVFISLTACYILGFDISLYARPRRRTWFVVALSGLLVYVSGAGAGLFAFTAFLASYFLFFSRIHAYLKAGVFPLLLLAPVLILTNLSFLTGRPSAFHSVESRVGIIGNLLSSMSPREMAIGKGLGVGSDVAITIQRLHPEMLTGIDNLFGSDSLYAAMLGQMGLVFVVVFLVFNFRVFGRSLRVRDHGVHPIVILAIPAILAGANGSVTTEVFPVNWLLFLLYGMALKGCACGRRDREHSTPRYDLCLAQPEVVP